MQLVGGHFDLEMNFIIQETESITCMVELLDKCDSTCQAEVWSMFTAVLKKSLRNLQACTEVGLIQLVLQRIDRVDAMIAGVWNGGIFRHQMIFQFISSHDSIPVQICTISTFFAAFEKIY